MWYIRSCGWYADVDTIFFDYDQNWLWMTLIVGRSQQDSFQINPRQWEGLFGDCKQFSESLESIIEDCESIYNRKA
jgi:hypothetical protein